MKLNKVIRIAWAGLIRNKLRSLLTMLGVIIGVGAVIIMISISAGTEATIAEEINSLGTDLLFVSSPFGRRGPGENDSPILTYDDGIALQEDLSSVIGVSTERNSAETIKFGSIVLEEVSIVGTTPAFPSVRDVGVAEGRFFTEQELERKTKVVVLGATIAQELFGDEDPIGQSITVGNTKLSVIGVAEEKGTVAGQDFDARIYMPITVVFQKFTPSQFSRIIGDRVGLIYVQIDPNESIDGVILQVELLLAKRKDLTLEEFPFTIQTQQDLISTQESTTEAFRSLLAWVAGVSLLVGGIGIMNIMLVSVTERTREIGIRQSVGATPNDIRMQFLTEALMLSLVGGVLGVISGVAGAFIFGAAAEMRTVIVPSSIVLAFSSAAMIGVFFGYYPANAAAQLDPIDALRHE
ncbi:MAG: ABC transporter permease [Chloroflexota bacterium]